MNKPTLTVCLLTYNQAPYVKEAIESVLKQRVNFSWELIIADDCSADGTREILLEYKKKSPDFIKLILQKNNVGPEKNWLDLMSHPRSQYVIYMEGDDYLTDPTKLQKQVDFLETHKDFSLCFHPVKVTYEDRSRPDEVFPSPEYRFNKNVLELKDLLGHNFIQTDSVMYRWRFIEEDIKDIFPKNIIPGDWFLHVLHAQLGKIGFIDSVMSVYRRHPGGLWWDSHADIDIIWQKHGLPHFAMYVELLRLCGKNTEHKKIINGHIVKMLNTLIETDRKYDKNSVGRAIKQFPESAETFMIEQHGELESRDASLEAKTEETHSLKHTIQQKDQLLGQKDQELAMIKSSRVWKLRNRIAQLLGKEAI